MFTVALQGMFTTTRAKSDSKNGRMTLKFELYCFLPCINLYLAASHTKWYSNYQSQQPSASTLLQRELQFMH